MARWFILLITFLAWAGTLLLIHRSFAPKPLALEALSNQQALEALFSDRAPRKERWRIYMNPEVGPALKRSPELPALLAPDWKSANHALLAAAEEAGAQPGEISVGAFQIKLKPMGETWMEQHTTIEMDIPEGMAPLIAQIVGEQPLECRAKYNMDTGLMSFRMSFKTGVGFEIEAIGSRDGDKFTGVFNIFQGGKKLTEQLMSIPITGASAPVLTDSPFYFKPSIREGDHWNVAMLSPSASGEQCEMETWEAQVIGRRAILYHGRQMQTLEVQAQCGRKMATAFYSVDGIVLKQKWKLQDTMNITLIREEEEEAGEIQVPGIKERKRVPRGH